MKLCRSFNWKGALAHSVALNHAYTLSILAHSVTLSLICAFIHSCVRVIHTQSRIHAPISFEPITFMHALFILQLALINVLSVNHPFSHAGTHLFVFRTIFIHSFLLLRCHLCMHSLIHLFYACAHLLTLIHHLIIV